MGERVRLGEVTVPSGTLVVVDAGMLGLERYGELAVEIGEVAAGNPLAVVGERLDPGDPASGLRWVGIEILPGAERTAHRPAGEVFVEFANVLFTDRKALEGWEHHRSLDGRADFVFRGRDARDVAASVGAERLDDGWGWLNLPAAECERKVRLVEEIVRHNGRAVDLDHRPHSHLHRLRLQMEASPQGVGEIDLDAARLCAVRTVPGKGQFQVVRDQAADGRLARIRVELVPQAAPKEPAVPSMPAGREIVGPGPQSQARHDPSRADDEEPPSGVPEPEHAAPRGESPGSGREPHRAAKRAAPRPAAGPRSAKRAPSRNTASPVATVQLAPDGDRLILITPRGYRIEGLPAGDLIEVLKALEDL